MDGVHVNVFWGVQSQNQRGSEAGKEGGCIHVVHYRAGHSSAANIAGSPVTKDAAQSPFISNQPLRKRAANSTNGSFPLPVPHLSKYAHWALMPALPGCVSRSMEKPVSAGLAYSVHMRSVSTSWLAPCKGRPWLAAVMTVLFPIVVDNGASCHQSYSGQEARPGDKAEWSGVAHQLGLVQNAS